MPKEMTRSQIRAKMKNLKSNLHYWQMMARMDRNSYRSSINNVHHYADEMRKLQKIAREKENKPKIGVKMSAKKQTNTG